MSIFLTLAYLFFIGSILGWCLELCYRNIASKRKKWINPGFCTGPYLPIYGFGLCVLYLLASLEPLYIIKHHGLNKIMLFIFMAFGMTIIEYISGIFCLKILKVRLWDYSDRFGNIQGIICPVFSAAWSILGAVYYFLIHPHILHALHWLSENLAFSFFIGMFFGIFIIDVVHSAQIILKLKQFAEENEVILKYEALKDHIHNVHMKNASKYHFFSPFRSATPLNEHLRDMYLNIEKQKQELKVRRKQRHLNKKRS